MGKRVKKDRVRKSVTKKTPASRKAAKTEPLPAESLEQLMHQKEEIEALLSSLEDAYSEAAILEDDYNDIKEKNEKKLQEINRKIDSLSKRQPVAAIEPIRAPAPTRLPRLPVAIPTFEEEAEEAEEKPEEKKEKRGKAKGEKTVAGISEDDIEKLEIDLAEKIKEMVEDIGTKVTEKDLLEMKNSFAKFEAEIDKMKAQVEAVKEGKRIDEEKIQHVAEGVAEIRTMVYGREASVKEQEIKFEKVMDVMGRIEPDKILMDMGRRDKEIGNLGLRLSKLEETTKEFGEMLKRIETLLRNIGSLEHVLSISNDASEKLMEMGDIQRVNTKMRDKIQGIYAELSKRMEEFMLYRAKQERVEDLLNEVMKNLNDLSTKSAYFITKDDLESFRSAIQTTMAAQPVSTVESYSLDSQKEEIEMLLKTLEDEYKNKSISKEEYEKMRNANLAKIREIESKMKGGGKAAPPPRMTEEEPAPPKKPAAKERKPEVPKEAKSRNEMLLKDLEETYKKGFISKEAYEKTRKVILGKK
jgi:chromosome segregation ATPase